MSSAVSTAALLLQWKIYGNREQNNRIHHVTPEAHHVNLTPQLTHQVISTPKKASSSFAAILLVGSAIRKRAVHKKLVWAKRN